MSKKTPARLILVVCIIFTLIFSTGFTNKPSGGILLDPPLESTPAPSPDQSTLQENGKIPPPQDATESISNEMRTFTGDLTSNLAPASITPSSSGWTTIMSQNFESGFPTAGWSLHDVANSYDFYLWGATTFKPHTGSYSAWPAKAGDLGMEPFSFPFYPPDLDTWMVYGPFDLSNATDAELLFSYWNSSEYEYDEFFWGASVDGVHFAGTGVSGNSGGWVAENFDLTNVYTLGNLTGRQNVWIGFNFYSDSSNSGYYGSFVDDIVLQKYSLVPPGQFGKSTPAYGIKEQLISPMLSWTASNGASYYEYCISTSTPCSSWTNNGTSTSVTVPGLSWDTRYYWNVRAVNDAGTTYSDNSTNDWLFRTMLKPVPALTSLSPAYTLVNSSNLTLTINGTGFVNGDTASWNGVPLTTTFVSSTQLTASINAADLTTISTAQITVTDPDLVVSNALPFSIHTFADAVPTSWYWRYVEGFYAKGITTGCDTGPLRYCPDRAVTRAEMAVFVLRSQHADALPYTPNPDPSVVGAFADVPFSGKEWMQPWIEEFYQSGMTTGCNTNPLRYCPERQVTRAEMAVFVLRAVHGKDYVPPTATGVFSDVPVSGKEWMQSWVEQFYREGITTGCAQSPLRYCPEQPVTRAEMATFLDRAFGFPQLP